MKAITILPGNDGVHYEDMEEPQCRTDYDVKLRVLQVGICGTDREEVKTGKVTSPAGSAHLVIGHEMLGRVVDAGNKVTKVGKGDYAVFTVRRGCGQCVPCKNNRSDMCYTGGYSERGIKGVHGFETEYVVDDEQYLVKVPTSIAAVGVLTEPMSVAQKAIDEALRVQMSRLPEVNHGDWLSGKKVLIAGLGAIGLLAAFAMKLKGAHILGLDVVSRDSKRVKILEGLGGIYINGRQVDAENIDDQCGEVDFIFEAAGVASLGFRLIDALGTNGIYVMTGIPGDDRPVCFEGAEVMKQMVMKNQMILGSVNASTRHFDLAIQDLERASEQYGDLLSQMITSRISYSAFMDAIEFRSEDDIKTVIAW